MFLYVTPEETGYTAVTELMVWVKDLTACCGTLANLPNFSVALHSAIVEVSATSQDGVRRAKQTKLVE